MKEAWVRGATSGRVAAVVIVGALLTACGSSSHTGSPSSATGSVPSATGNASSGDGVSVSTTSLAAVTAPSSSSGPSRCPTLTQAERALGGSYRGPHRTPVSTVGVVCEYTAGAASANAGVTVFAHQSSSVFSGQVANAGRAPGMQKISGVGDGGFGLVAGGRSIVNAWSNTSMTVVAAQSAGSLSQTEALAQVALADNT
jgi:hypothetical protein